MYNASPKQGKKSRKGSSRRQVEEEAEGEQLEVQGPSTDPNVAKGMSDVEDGPGTGLIFETVEKFHFLEDENEDEGWYFPFKKEFRVLDYFVSKQPSKGDQIIVDILHPFDVNDRMDMHRILPLIANSSLLQDAQGMEPGIQLWNTYSDLCAVATWICSNNVKVLGKKQRGIDPGPTEYPTRDELVTISCQVLVNHSLGSLKTDDKPSTSNSLPKFPTETEKYMDWKLKSLSILAKAGLVKIVQSKSYADANPRSSSVVHGMVMEAVTQSYGQIVTHMLSSTYEDEHCGYTAWQEVTKINESNYMLSIQMAQAIRDFKKLTMDDSKPINSFVYPLMAYKAAITQISLTAQQRKYEITCEYASWLPRRWCEELTSRLANTKYAAWTGNALHNHPDDLSLLIAYIVKEYQGSLVPESKPNTTRGSASSNERVDKSSPSSAAKSDILNQFHRNIKNSDFSEEDKKKIKELLRKKPNVPDKRPAETMDNDSSKRQRTKGMYPDSTTSRRTTCNGDSLEALPDEAVYSVTHNLTFIGPTGKWKKKGKQGS
ncbi:hypothetical protein ACA910_007386 [Epithemia clementina (nom. ined.)]